MSTISIRPAFAGLLPHPPIVIPSVAMERLDQCRSTTAACREFARRLCAARPDRLVLVSPHAPRKPTAFGIYTGRCLRGDLSRFGVGRVEVSLPNDLDVVEALQSAAVGSGVQTWRIPAGQELDHGAVVPFWFLREAGWNGPTCIASLPWQSTPGLLAAFGKVVAAAVGQQRSRAALVASGDMTHRAQPGAPAGFDKRAVEFDYALTSLVREGRLRGIGDIDPKLRDLAAEDAADSAIVVAAAIGFEPHGNEVLSYEHPFGVGYLVAVFHDGAGCGCTPE